MLSLWVFIKLINTVCQLLQHFYCSLAQVLMLINIIFRQYLVKSQGYSTFQNGWEVNQNRQLYKVNKFDLFPYVKALLPSPWCNKLSQPIMISLPSSFHQKTVRFGNKSLTRSTPLFHQIFSLGPFENMISHLFKAYCHDKNSVWLKKVSHLTFPHYVAWNKMTVLLYQVSHSKRTRKIALWRFHVFLPFKNGFTLSLTQQCLCSR